MNYGNRIKASIFRAAGLAAGIIVAILLTEAVFRLSKPLTCIYSPAGKTFEAVYVPNGDYVYGLNPDTVYKHYSYYGDFVATYHINSEALRSEREYARAKPAGTKRVLMIGDSYCFGRGVEDDETCAYVLERTFNSNRKPVEVLNSGVLGYSPDNEYLYLKKRGMAFDPDIVVLTLFPRNDVMDMLNHDWVAGNDGLPLKISDRSYAVDSYHHLVNISKGDKALNPGRLKKFIRDNSYIYAFLSEYRYYMKDRWRLLKSYFADLDKRKKPPSAQGPAQAFDIEKASPDEKKMLARVCLLLEGMRDTVLAGGAKFLVVLVPDSVYDDYLLKFMESNRIDVIDIRERAKRDNRRNLYLKKDMHWSREGNVYVAGLIYDELKDRLF